MNFIVAIYSFLPRAKTYPLIEKWACGVGPGSAFKCRPARTSYF